MIADAINSPKWDDEPSLDQNRLNISTRSRTSRLPWRGQFSPELIEYLLTDICGPIDSVYDPFCGSGTVLFEGIRHNISVYGAEINPAAWHMAALARFAFMSQDEKREVLSDLKQIIGHYDNIGTIPDEQSIDIATLMQHTFRLPFSRLAIATCVIVGMGNNSSLTASSFVKGSISVLSVLNELLGARQQHATVTLGDARESPLRTNSVGAVITSPPYINVFNYHQNNRAAVELLGWKPLNAARSEIGANRKFRQNRFFTVTQYCLDIQQSIYESTRILQQSGRFIIILGRTSNVLGTSFLNANIIKDVMRHDGNLEIIQVGERVFTNRFGETIYEDVIIAEKKALNPVNKKNAIIVARQALVEGLAIVPDKNRSLLVEAIDKVDTIEPSPILDITYPAVFQ